ncbi:MAG: malto-oligosyltrehalose synthase, partial [Nitrospiria bacterium]
MHAWPYMSRPLVSTYRLQFNRGFRFSDALRIVPYLHALGITDCYASPFLTAVPGSLHGYDLADPTTLNPEVGTEAEYRRFVQALQSNGMGLILDVVANHMGIGKSANPWWQDLLENGPSSPYAGYFDIDWHPGLPELEEKILLPVLGVPYQTAMENQEIRLTYKEGAFSASYYEHEFPIDPRSSLRILGHRFDHPIQKTNSADKGIQALQEIMTALNDLPIRSEKNPQRKAVRSRKNEAIKKRLAGLVDRSRLIRTFIEENVLAFNGRKGDRGSFNHLNALLNDQAYRLAHWRLAGEAVNYRRFFDINELAAIRMEDPATFEAVHQCLFRLIKEGGVTGLRIDHVDGLSDPEDYLRRLQQRATAHLPADGGASERPFYIVAEKILADDERLPGDWPVAGTTGYEFLYLLNNLFVNRRNEEAFDALYSRFIGERLSFEDLIYEKKRMIMQTTMQSEINALGRQLKPLTERNRQTRPFSLEELTQAALEMIACFPVYRTYITGGEAGVTKRDKAIILKAAREAKHRNPISLGPAIDFLRDLLLRVNDKVPEEDRKARHLFLTRFQQTTPPITAKGVEDTALYCYNRLLSLNEVGGDPGRFGIGLTDFHNRMRERQGRTPYTLSATSTHDTKRGEDVRARINVLSELPQTWEVVLTRWAEMNEEKKQWIENEPVPDRNEEYFLYQTLLGAWPLGQLSPEDERAFRGRIQRYMTKALREAKIHTSWIDQNGVYEEAVHAFIETILNRSSPNPFLDDFLRFQAKIAEYGIYNALSQTLIKITAPGIPDFYQGSALWDLRLVDPDNRGPVDYEARSRLLANLHARCKGDIVNRKRLVRELIKTRTDGRIKCYMTATALHYRRVHPSLFLEG